MEYVIEYGLFLAKTATLVVAFIVVIGTIVSASTRRRGLNVNRGSIHVTRLNDELDDMRDAMKKAIHDKVVLKQEMKEEKKRDKQEEKARKRAAKQGDKSAEEIKKRCYLLDFDGDIAASDVESLREEITAVLAMATDRDEVILRLESPGGMVHSYGLASSQLARIRAANIPLTICVDKVAASGGYMMACLANRLVAAPFAILGSIGVLVQLPNFNRLLRKHDVDYETITAGEYKSTLSTFGQITQRGREKVQEDIEEMHALFKAWVKQHRPVVDIDGIATGETWVGMQALERQMIDGIMTSDELIVRACDEADVYSVRYEIRQTLGDRLGVAVHKGLDRSVLALLRRVRDSSFYS